jgi:hypothetical protein
LFNEGRVIENSAKINYLTITSIDQEPKQSLKSIETSVTTESCARHVECCCCYDSQESDENPSGDDDCDDDDIVHVNSIPLTSEEADILLRQKNLPVFGSLKNFNSSPLTIFDLYRDLQQPQISRERSMSDECEMGHEFNI